MVQVFRGCKFVYCDNYINTINTLRIYKVKLINVKVLGAWNDLEVVMVKVIAYISQNCMWCPSELYLKLYNLTTTEYDSVSVSKSKFFACKLIKIKN
jgi:hypothetical protein